MSEFCSQFTVHSQFTAHTAQLHENRVRESSIVGIGNRKIVGVLFTVSRESSPRIVWIRNPEIVEVLFTVHSFTRIKSENRRDRKSGNCRSSFYSPQLHESQVRESSGLENRKFSEFCSQLHENQVRGSSGPEIRKLSEFCSQFTATQLHESQVRESSGLETRKMSEFCSQLTASRESSPRIFGVGNPENVGVLFSSQLKYSVRSEPRDSRSISELLYSL